MSKLFRGTALALILIVGLGASVWASGQQGADDGASGAGDGLVPVTMMRKGNLPDAFVNAVNSQIADLREMYGIDLEITWGGANEYTQKVNVVWASGELPNIIHLPGMPVKIRQGIEAGAFAPMDDAIESHPVWSQVDDSYFLTSTYNGKRYTIPKKGSTPEAMIYRADWLENTGMERPADPESLYEVLYAFTHGDPNENGEDDTIGFSIMSDYMASDPLWRMFVPGMNPAAQLDLYLDESDDTIKATASDIEGMKQALAWFRRAYADGVLDNEFMLAKNLDVENKFTTGMSGMWLKGPEWILPRYKTLSETFGDDVDVTSVRNFQGEYGPVYGTYGGGGTSDYFVTTESEYVEEAKQALLYYWGPEGIKTLRLGNEGVTYEIVDGEFRWIDEQLGEKFNPGNFVTSIFDIEIPFELPVVEQTVAGTEGFELMFDPYPYATQSELFNERQADFVKTTQEFVTKIIIGELPVDAVETMWEEYEILGIDEVLEEVNEAYQASK